MLNGEFELAMPTTAPSPSRWKTTSGPRFCVQLDSVPGRPQLGQPLAVTRPGPRLRRAGHRRRHGAATASRAASYAPLFDYGFRRGSTRSTAAAARKLPTAPPAPTPTAASASRFTPPLVRRPRAGRRGWEPGYLFEVTADVTDAAGETRTGTRGFPIGRNPLSLQPDRAPAEMLTSSACPPSGLLGANATGEPLPAAGTLRLLARPLLAPTRPACPAPPPDEARRRTEPAPALVNTLAFDTKAGPALDLTRRPGGPAHRPLPPRSPGRRPRLGAGAARLHALRLGGRHHALRHARLVCGAGRHRGARPASRASCWAAARPRPASCWKWSAAASCCARSG
ncbi:MAG: hypothetical protein WKG07_20370 [Hymenobacter sp.]